MNKIKETRCKPQDRKISKGGEGSGPTLEWDCPDDYLVVESSKCSSNERSHPENPLRKRE